MTTEKNRKLKLFTAAALMALSTVAAVGVTYKGAKAASTVFNTFCAPPEQTKNLSYAESRELKDTLDKAVGETALATTLLLVNGVGFNVGLAGLRRFGKAPKA